MNSLFLALDRFGLAQDFLALAAGLAQHCRRVSQFTQIYPGPGPALTDGRETRSRDTQTEERDLDTLRHNDNVICLNDKRRCVELFDCSLLYKHK